MPVNALDERAILQNNPTFQEHDHTFAAFAGCDIVAYMNHKRISNLQGITFSITREKMPLYTMGDPNFKGVAKGKRAIAGNLVFTMFDKHALLRAINLMGNKDVNYIGDMDYFQVPQNIRLLGGGFSNFANDVNTLTETSINSIRQSTATDDAYRRAVENELAETFALVATRKFKFSDQLPPFDVTITMVNEQGQAATMTIRGIDIVSEGGGYTLDDLSSEAAFTFIARDIDPLDSLTNFSSIYNSANSMNRYSF